MDQISPVPGQKIISPEYAWRARKRPALAALGLGTGMVYPTLLAAISDVAHPTWRGSAVGVYRLWRDGGYAVGALASGFLADLLGMSAAIAAISALTFLSGVMVTAVMRETLPGRTPAFIPVEVSNIGEGGIKERHF